MTLIAALELYGIPLLIGDLLISSTGEVRSHARLPTLTDVNVDNILPPEWMRSISSLRRKVAIINDGFAIGWAENLIAAKYVIKKLKEEFESRQVSRGEVFAFLNSFEDIGATIECIIVGWVIDTEGAICFEWNSTTKIVMVGKDQYIAGTGTDDFSLQLRNNFSLHHGTKESTTNLEKALHEALSLATTVIGKEVFTGRNLQQLYGGGIEIIYFTEGKFHQLDDLAFIFWKIDLVINQHIKLELINPILKLSYINDILIIQSSHLHINLTNDNSLNESTYDTYVIAPVYTHQLSPKPEYFKYRSLISSYYCNYNAVSVVGKPITNMPFILKNYPGNDILRFQTEWNRGQVDETIEGMIMNEKYGLCIYDFLNPIFEKFLKNPHQGT